MIYVSLIFIGICRNLAQRYYLYLRYLPKKTGAAHWHVLNRARAIENGAFVVAPCAVGNVEGGGGGYGHSLIINPWGEILADGGADSGFINVNIDLEEVSSARTRIPSLSHDKDFSS